MDQKMKNFPLTAQIFIGLLLGALAGVRAHDRAHRPPESPGVVRVDHCSTLSASVV